eukprot:m.254582 g.254582  ORF g.254582 m.254582 type:complete len:666 (-) comp18221_c0_seq1:596-2593(-)
MAEVQMQPPTSALHADEQVKPGFTASALETEPVELETLLEKTPITHATVFQNRAEVTRHIPLDFAEPNRKYMVHLRGLSSFIADEASVRVTGHGDFTILSMSIFSSKGQKALTEEQQRKANQANLDLQAPEPKHVLSDEELKARQEEITRLRLHESELRDKLRILDDSTTLVGTYSASVLSGKATTTDAASLMELLKPDSALHIVDQCLEKRRQLLQQKMDIKRELGICSKSLAELIALHDAQENAYQEACEAWRQKQEAAHTTLADINGRPAVDRKDATIMLDVYAVDRSSGSLSLTYVVSNAMWTPTYDLRANLTTGEIQLQYHGQVSQSTDEVWKDVHLTLSTAQPAIGGHPPKLKPIYYGERRTREPSAASQLAELSLHVAESSRSSASSRKSRAAAPSSATSVPPPASVATATVSSSSTGLATTFKIEGRTTIPNTRKTQRVTLATIQLQSRMRYFCVPRLTQAAYLQAYCTNLSLFPLLPSKTVNVFVNSNLVTTTQIGLVVPGESFSAFLGIDSGVRVTYSPAPQMDGVVRGMFYGSTKKQSLKTTCIVENLTPASAVVVVVDSVPQSQHQNIKVRLIHPASDSISTPDDIQSEDTLCGGGLTSGVDSKLKDHPAIIRNKYTNNLIWTCLLDQHQKQELVLEYDIEYPHTMAIDTYTA